MPAFAQNNEQDSIKNTGALLNDSTLTPEKIKQLDKEARVKDKKIEEKEKNDASINSDPDGEYYSISVTNYIQENGHYCGPASVRQSLSFHKKKSGSTVALPSQNILASLSGTTSDGSSTTGLKTAINNYASTYDFEDDKYVVGNVNDSSNPMYIFESRIKNDLKYQTNAPILLVSTDKLDRYNGKYLRHYVTISAYSYDKATGEKLLRIVDPNYDSNYSGIYWEPIDNVFAAVKKSDDNGDNYVMLY